GPGQAPEGPRPDARDPARREWTVRTRTSPRPAPRAAADAGREDVGDVQHLAAAGARRPLAYRERRMDAEGGDVVLGPGVRHLDHLPQVRGGAAHEGRLPHP